MKKVLLSSIVIISFIFYSLHERSETEDIKIIVPPTTMQNQSSMMQSRMMNRYRNGTHTGDVADAFYGNMQVRVIIKNEKISDIIFLQYPNERSTSMEINTQSNQILKQEAIQNQSAEVDIVSGATQSSQAFIKSLQSALDKAKI